MNGNEGFGLFLVWSWMLDFRALEARSSDHYDPYNAGFDWLLGVAVGSSACRTRRREAPHAQTTRNK
jgi:hypothetical protein